ncbi:cyclic nucleotide-binding domain-containing protein [Phototrophicus methaneseepsis]|uniref:Cyclic nucleotide-binding domain-containing protein n=1 Tax=Phototrophicus methaneseepsis TaxID=2710758 RepID=A0A7S8E6V7_9CHLR|nr:cyclic nucleotide-binding domain-containing protein [Phototrophicus methaneseepsis]QPC81398.1 cyclic nucleotide-binding domain-containing protein [Phototrophicus methaneseepsis]
MPAIDYFKTAEDIETFNAGDIIFEQGDEGKAMYVVRSGEVTILYNDTELATLGENEFFGEMTLVDDTNRSAKAMAKTDCVVVPVDKGRFLFLVHETPTFALQVMNVMSQRLRKMHEVLGQ